jgi:hypothetical protein
MQRMSVKGGDEEEWREEDLGGLSILVDAGLAELRRLRPPAWTVRGVTGYRMYVDRLREQMGRCRQCGCLIDAMSQWRIVGLRLNGPGPIDDEIWLMSVCPSAGVLKQE